MNATRLAMVISPLATRKPPAPSTTSSETCSAIALSGTISAEIFATRTPAWYAPIASSTTASVSRVVAFEARTVRMALIERSTEAARSPTFSCCSRLAVRTRPESSTTATTETAITSTVRPSSTGSMISIAMSAPMNSTAPPIASTSPCVMTA